MAGKGGSFERDICRQLSLWWTSGEDDDCFWRNRTRRTVHAYNAQFQEGDIMATKEVARPMTDLFCIELKSGYSIKRSPTKKTKAKRAEKKEKVHNVPWDLLDLIDGRGERSEKAIVRFWMQANKAATKTKRIPLLIFKRDFHTPCVAIDYEFLDSFRISPFPMITLDNGANDISTLWFFSLEDFFRTVKPYEIKKVLIEREREFKRAAKRLA